MRILKYFPAGTLFALKDVVDSNLHKYIMCFNAHTEEIHDYITEVIQSFVPASGFYFMDLWLSWLDANNYGYFLAKTYAEKLRNVYARFKLSKTNTLAGIIKYLTYLGYDIDQNPVLSRYGFPLEFPYSFVYGIPSVDKIVIASGKSFSDTYPNGYFDTLQDAKLSLIVYFPSETTEEIKLKFKQALEEVVCVQYRIVYETTS